MIIRLIICSVIWTFVYRITYRLELGSNPPVPRPNIVRRFASFIAVRRNISQCGEILRKLQFHGRRLCPVPRPNIIIKLLQLPCGDLHLHLRAETEIILSECMSPKSHCDHYSRTNCKSSLISV